jgi:hypothetical protein
LAAYYFAPSLRSSAFSILFAFQQLIDKCCSLMGAQTMRF